MAAAATAAGSATADMDSSNPVLPKSVLDAAASLPSRPDPATLVGPNITLRPYVEADAADLFAAANGTEWNGHPAYEGNLVWRYMPNGPYAPDELAKFTSDWNAIAARPGYLTLTVVDNATKRLIGMVTILNNVPEHLKAELGYVWFTPAVHRTYANTESAYLIMEHLFKLGYRRVEWKCDALNKKSMAAAMRLGFRYEGTQRHHFIVKGRNRDTAWFAVMVEDWPSVQADHLRRREDYAAAASRVSIPGTSGAGAGAGAGSATPQAMVPTPLIAVGDRFPSVTLYEGTCDDAVDTATFLAGRRVVLFGVPGAFTRGCSKTHLPGYVKDADKIRAKGVAEIACVSVNDPFVHAAWGVAHNAEGRVRMLADPTGVLPRVLGLVLDRRASLGSDRLQRFSMVLDDGVVTAFHHEPDGRGLTCSLSNPLLASLDELPAYK